SIEIEPAFLVIRAARLFFGLEAKQAEVVQQAGKYAQLIFLWKIIVDEYNGWIQRSHITVKDTFGCSLVLHMGIAADDFFAFVGTGYRTALVKILAQEKRIDFRGIPAQRDVLIAIRKDLRLDEMAG